MKISKPEKAIGAFEQALRKNPADAALQARDQANGSVG